MMHQERGFSKSDVSDLETSHYTISKNCGGLHNSTMNRGNYLAQNVQDNKDLRDSTSSSKVRQRRPDMPLYVPRARRLETNGLKSSPHVEESYCRKTANAKGSKQTISKNKSFSANSIENSSDCKLSNKGIPHEIMNTSEKLVAYRSDTVTPDVESFPQVNSDFEMMVLKNIVELSDSFFNDKVCSKNMPKKNSVEDENERGLEIPTPDHVKKPKEYSLGDSSISSDTHDKLVSVPRFDDELLTVCHASDENVEENKIYVPFCVDNCMVPVCNPDCNFVNDSIQAEVLCACDHKFSTDETISHIKSSPVFEETSKPKIFCQPFVDCDESDILAKSLCNEADITVNNKLSCPGMDPNESLCKSLQTVCPSSENMKSEYNFKILESNDQFLVDSSSVESERNIIAKIVSFKDPLLTENKSESVAKSVTKSISDNIHSDNDTVLSLDYCKKQDIQLENSEEPVFQFCELPVNLKHEQSSDDSDSSKAEDSWDSMFDDNGECLNPSIVKELFDAIGNVKIKTLGKKYSEFQPRESTVDEEYGHIIEIHGFPPEFNTQDLVSAFSCFRAQDYTIKWVDDCHALGVFASPFVATEALTLQHPCIKVRPLSQGIRESKLKAKRLSEQRVPLRPRPATSATLARRLVSGALGLKINISKEQRESERKAIMEARERKRQVAKQRQDAWNGIVS